MTKQEIIDKIVDECDKQGLVLDEQKAYVLATVKWETGHTFQSVKESYWKTEAWRKRNLRYFPYYGRGMVQLTHKYNYEKFGKLLGIDLVNYPDKALDTETSIFILVYGFKHGSFTGRELERYINVEQTDFYNARRCINGLDQAEKIAEIAEEFLAGGIVEDN